MTAANIAPCVTSMSQGRGQYFSPDGKSLRKAFIRAPVQFSRISSRFNPSRRHPVLNRIRAHEASTTPRQWARRCAPPAKAACASSGKQGGYGNVIELEHGSGVVTVYGHLSRFATKAAPRSARRPRAGHRLSSGKTGLATGPHLHYEYRIRGVHKNPQTVPLPDAEPIPDAERERFPAPRPAW